MSPSRLQRLWPQIDQSIRAASAISHHGRTRHGAARWFRRVLGLDGIPVKSPCSKNPGRRGLNKHLDNSRVRNKRQRKELNLYCWSNRMPSTPSIVPYGADQTVYVVVDSFGANGTVYRETE